MFTFPYNIHLILVGYILFTAAVVFAFIRIDQIKQCGRSHTVFIIQVARLSFWLHNFFFFFFASFSSSLSTGCKHSYTYGWQAHGDTQQATRMGNNKLHRMWIIIAVVPMLWPLGLLQSKIYFIRNSM